MGRRLPDQPWEKASHLYSIRSTGHGERMNISIHLAGLKVPGNMRPMLEAQPI